MSAAFGGRSLSLDVTPGRTAADQGRRPVQGVGIGRRASEPGAAHPGLASCGSGSSRGALELADVAVEVAGIVPVEGVVGAAVVAEVVGAADPVVDPIVHRVVDGDVR
jgi:hypothetical protein